MKDAVQSRTKDKSVPADPVEYGKSMSLQEAAQEFSPRLSANFSFHRSHSISELPDQKTGTSPVAMIMRSVVRIYTTAAARSFLLPWHVARQKDSTGTGFIVSVKDKLIMTNAHVVMNHNFIQIKQQDDARKFEAKLILIAHDIDLALLTIPNEDFWKTAVSFVNFSDGLPQLYSEVKAVGFPTGGSTICVTKGVVSRLDAQLYVHPRLCGIVSGATHNNGPVIIIQIDAAINPGNSGGPTFDAFGACCGIASSGNPGAQNVGYIIPSKIAQNFLHAYQTTGRWPGVCEAGFQTRSLENAAMRAFYQLHENSTGVQVRSVSPLSVLHGRIMKGDVLLECDGKQISNEGTVAVDVSGNSVQLNFQALITQKREGDKTTLKIFRPVDGEMTIEAELTPLPALMPRFDNIDCEPTYFICGGLVFSIISTPLKCEYFESQKNAGIYFPKESLTPAMYQWKESANHEIVCLLRGLKHSVNAGYDLNSLRVLYSFNGMPINNLVSLVQAVSECKNNPAANPFLCFAFIAADDDMSGSQEDPDIVLRTSECATADEEILLMHRIPALMSQCLSNKIPLKSEA